MRFYYLLSVAVLFALASCKGGASCDTGVKDVKLTAKIDSLSYYLGIMQGKGIASRSAFRGIPGDTVSLDAFWAGMVTGYKGQEGILDTSMSAAEAYLQAAIKDIQMQEQTKAQALAASNKENGEKFLAENERKNGVIVTNSGLQYQIITEGTGKRPKATDKVKVNYEGSLIDGTIFDSSIQRGEPVTFEANRVIPGWTEALQLMRVGSKWKLFIPSELAYGERGAGQQIPGNSTLIFEVELLEVNPSN